jgi:hypothetical protein
LLQIGDITLAKQGNKETFENKAIRGGMAHFIAHGKTHPSFEMTGD